MLAIAVSTLKLFLLVIIRKAMLFLSVALDGKCTQSYMITEILAANLNKFIILYVKKLSANITSRSSSWDHKEVEQSVFFISQDLHYVSYYLLTIYSSFVM